MAPSVITGMVGGTRAGYGQDQQQKAVPGGVRKAPPRPMPPAQMPPQMGQSADAMPAPRQMAPPSPMPGYTPNPMPGYTAPAPRQMAPTRQMQAPTTPGVSDQTMAPRAPLPPAAPPMSTDGGALGQMPPGRIPAPKPAPMQKPAPPIGGGGGMSDF